MSQPLNPEFDLTVSRIIKAPRASVWKAWTDPASLEQWWVPKPGRTKVTELDVRPGGAFTTLYSEDGGDFGPHLDACFLAVDEAERLVFTDALRAGWRPAEKGFMTAIITFADHPEGTDYSASAMHGSRASRDRHEEQGFYDGWGTVVRQLAELVER